MPHPSELGLHFIYLETHTVIVKHQTKTIDLTQFGLKIHILPNAFLESAVNITVSACRETSHLLD